MHADLDCRGLACPAPVLRVKQTLEEENPAGMTVLVDNDAARQNVSRFLEHNGYRVESHQQGDGFRVIALRGEGMELSLTPAPPAAIGQGKGGSRRIMVLISGETLGRGDDGLGDMLMFSFLNTLKEMGPELWRVVLVNGGVRFTAEGSEGVPVLHELAERGVEVLACGACLGYFHILDRMQVGRVTNMLEVVTSMEQADSVITV